MSITSDLCGKKILIWGYGREGKSTERFLNSFCEVSSLEVYEGTREGINEEAYDYIIKSPGIVMKEEHAKYISQTDLFLGEFRDQTVGITGTKGKSTTSTMLSDVLKKSSGRPVILLGNIGYPCLDYYGDISSDTIIVFEMSCHQLAHAKVSPHVSIFLNLYEEHLDYYETVDAYFNAKSNIARYQKAGDYFFVGNNVPEIAKKAQTTMISPVGENKYSLKLIGAQNQFNGEFVYQVATKVFACQPSKVLAAMSNFEGLPHRLEHIANINGVDYYDDSISTIPEATMSAVAGVANVQTILLGGMDRKIDYTQLVQFIKDNTHIQFICMYESGKRIYKEVEDNANTFYCENLETAVTLAKEITLPGKACLLSPASASYGDFKNFEERGEAFVKLVK